MSRVYNFSALTGSIARKCSKISSRRDVRLQGMRNVGYGDES